jgi:hypothetical protein
MVRGVIVLLAVGAILAGCRGVDLHPGGCPGEGEEAALTAYPDSLGYVTLEELFANPERYNGRTVRTEGICVSGFEVSGLGASTYNRGDAVSLTEPAIWVESAVFESKTDCFTTQPTPQATFCRVIVRGMFEYGKRCGHLGGYAYRLSAPEE